MNRKSKLLISILIAFTMTVQGYTFVFADSSPTVTNYFLFDTGNIQLSRMDGGDKGRLELILEDGALKTEDIIRKDNIDVQEISGCFASPSLSGRELLSSAGESLGYKLIFEDVAYTGTGKYFNFKVRYKNLGITSSLIKLKINECSESGSDSSDSSVSADENGNVTVKNAMPKVEIIREDVKTVKEGESFTVNLVIKNHGSVSMIKPVVTISTNGDIKLSANTSSFFISDIKAGGKIVLPLSFKAEDKLSSNIQEFTAAVNFDYNSGTDGNTTGSETALITIPSEPTKETDIPTVQVSMGSVTAVGSDKSIQLPIIVSNLSSTPIKDTVITLKGDSGIYVSDGTASKNIGDIDANSSKTVYMALKTSKKLENNYQELQCSAKYRYKELNQMKSDTASETFYIPVIPDEEATKAEDPVIRITKSDIVDPVAENTPFSFKLIVSNVGNTDIKNAILSISGTDEIMLLSNSDTLPISSLKAGQSITHTVNCRTVKGLLSSSQALSADLKYTYDSEIGGKNSAESLKTDTESVKIIIPTIKKEEEKEEEKIKASVPNIIIDSFDYGGQSIAAGKDFTLVIRYKNSGTLPVSNIVMSVSPDDKTTIGSGMNTFYNGTLSPGEIYTQELGMRALPTAEPGSSKISVDFKYEYVDEKTRNDVDTSQSVSVPVYKPDLMEITPQTEELLGSVGEELYISLDYTNKGKSEVSNFRAEISGDSMECPKKVQNVGNIEAGKSGTVNFMITPLEAGEASVKIKVTYEDANMAEKERVFEIPYSAEEMYFDDSDYYDAELPEEENSGIPAWVFWAGGIGGAVVIAVIIIIIVNNAKKKKDYVKVDWKE